ncbi:MAG TPA: SDR family oxidoreductase [Marmoricola sp.]|nr:SDR family oxidoreductase [Nocardioidaceae bacterium]HMU36036.1 SDR family oxidoreductase [Marmoricola sp.]MCB8992782.1 SDR family oxidoreductase [Nocardioidaceae bacterium]MCO5324752.1 SDR family oxidoreductase [Nocardioidaceae bacterium]HMY09654.1 SDR family oxidoreductase [Marmoricola sp.]
MSVSGKVIAITGGAQGIGAATARALSSAGAKVAVGDLDATLAAESARTYGGLGLKLDVSDAASFAAFLDQVEEQLGGIDVLVNNAGIMVIGRMLETPLDAQLKQLDVNLRGVILGCHAVVPRMRPGGQIINIASLAGKIPTPGSAVYSATKAGVLALSEALDAELAPRVRVSAVLPAFTNTRLIDGTTTPRLTSAIAPEQVADAVVGLIEKYKPIATVPPSLAVSSVQWGLMPQRLRRWMGNKTGMNTMFTEYDHAARAAYEKST